MIKTVINGPESTGKSTLAKQLAENFHGIWEPELARDYIEKLNQPYTFEDVCNIAQLQIKLQRRYEQQKTDSFVFFDTDLIITKVWFEYKYNQVPDFLTEELKKCYFDFYLLCEPDLPWIDDPVRENRENRAFFFDWYKREIETLEKPYAIVSGIGEQRLQNAIQAVKTFESTRR